MPQLKKKMGGSPTNNQLRKKGPTKKSSSGSSATGWAAVAKRKNQSDARSQLRGNRPAYLDVKNKFMIKDGETVRIQFLNAEPVCVEGCTVSAQNFDFYVSRKSVDKSCPLVEANLKLGFKAGFKLLDHRGTWNKDKRDHNFDESVEKIWLLSNQAATQLMALQERKKKPLTSMVLDCTRTGSDTKTTYTFEIARDEETDAMLEPEDYTEELPPLEDILTPLPRKTLELILGNEDFEEADAPI